MLDSVSSPAVPVYYVFVLFCGVEVIQWYKKLLFLLVYGSSAASAAGTYAGAWVLIQYSCWH